MRKFSRQRSQLRFIVFWVPKCDRCIAGLSPADIFSSQFWAQIIHFSDHRLTKFSPCFVPNILIFDGAFNEQSAEVGASGQIYWKRYYSCKSIQNSHSRHGLLSFIIKFGLDLKLAVACKRIKTRAFAKLGCCINCIPGGLGWRVIGSSKSCRKSIDWTCTTDL